MSAIKKWTRDYEQKLVRAFRKLRWGKRDPVTVELADGIKVIRSFLTRPDGRNDEVARRLTEELKSAQDYLTSGASKKLRSLTGTHRFLRGYMFRTAGMLLESAITSSKNLRRIADALDANDEQDPRQRNIFNAYMECFLNGGEPTLNEVKRRFVARSSEKSWTGDFNARKTLAFFGLTLKDDIVGRRKGSKSIRNR